MTLSLLLSEKGKKVHLYEAAPDIGGLADYWEFGDITWDRFYHVILMSDLNTRELLQKLGIENKMNWVETKTGFYTDGKLYSMSNSLEFLKFPPLRLIDKFRLGITIFFASKIKNWKKLEKQPVAKWLTKWSGKRTFNKMWLPLLRAKLGDFYTETSASFIWATIQRMYAARKSGLKKEMFGYMEGGYKTILESLKQKLTESGVEVHTSHILENVIKEEDTISLKFKNGTIVNTSDLVFTIPSSLILKVWPDMPKDEADKHNSIKYLGVSCTSVLLKKPISPFYVTNITDGHVPFTGVIEMSALVDKNNFNGNSLVYLPKYVGTDDPIFTRDDSEIHKEFKDSIVKMYDHISEEDILEMKTAKARNVFALSTLNYSTKLPEVCSKIKGIYYGNSALITNGTLNVNETIDIAKKIVNYIV
jgi:protoporphyrinogen oxidase